MNEKHLSNAIRFALMKEAQIRKARTCFLTFRRVMHPEQIWDAPFPQAVCAKLQDFYEKWMNGERPKMILSTPPQHGKSVAVTDFCCWIAGKHPDKKAIYASFSERLGRRANMAIQQMMDSEKFKEIFPDSRIKTKGEPETADAQRGVDLIEYISPVTGKHGGYFRNVTIKGAVTGESLDIGIIDDPLRDRKEANSELVRDNIWEWYTDAFLTRFHKDAPLLMILTRWHIDDLAGRILEKEKNVDYVRFPAIAEKDEGWRKEGEALFEEWKPLSFLLERKSVTPTANWEALYQQNPIIAGGEMFRDEWWQYYDQSTPLPEFEYRIIYADTAQKVKEHNDYSVFQCWGYHQGKIYLLDMLRGKWEAPDLLVKAKEFWQKHRDPTNRGYLRAFKVEDKASGTGLIQQLQRNGGVPVVGIPRGTDKVSRANDVIPQVQAGNVILPANAPWLDDMMAELTAFPNGVHDDTVDPLMDAITDMLMSGGVNWLSQWG